MGLAADPAAVIRLAFDSVLHLRWPLDLDARCATLGFPSHHDQFVVLPFSAG